MARSFSSTLVLALSSWSSFATYDKHGKRALIRRDAAEVDAAVMYCNTQGDAKPGTPKIDDLEKISTTHRFKTELAQLGDRLVAAADATDAVKACGSFWAFGDYAWCNRAMPAESQFARDNRYSGYTCNVSEAAASMLDLQATSKSRLENHGQYLGLSYGIEETDPWSELMSSMYFVHTRLFDCYTKTGRGPMFNDMHGNHSRINECQSRNCYTVGYEPNRVCLDATRKENADLGVKFEPLSDSLKGRPPLSTYVKLDVEGSEWQVLQNLVNSPEDIARIRSLDMEVHMLFDKHSGIDLAKRVEIMEQLAKHFAVTGSTIEPLFRNARRDFEKHRPVWPAGRIYTSKGFPLDQYCISFVNRRLLKDGEDTFGETPML